MSKAAVADGVKRDVSGPGPLAGVRVIELGMLLAGPFTGRLLGDMGAEIIKVEPPGKPDPLRDWGHARYEGRSLWWPACGERGGARDPLPIADCRSGDSFSDCGRRHWPFN